jgi:hypothetical protein
MRRFLWGGVAANLGSIVVIALAIGWVTTYLGSRRPANFGSDDPVAKI